MQLEEPGKPHIGKLRLFFSAMVTMMIDTVCLLAAIVANKLFIWE